jgi:hypothetical protein
VFPAGSLCKSNKPKVSGQDTTRPIQLPIAAGAWASYSQLCQPESPRQHWWQYKKPVATNTRGQAQACQPQQFHTVVLRPGDLSAIPISQCLSCCQAMQQCCCVITVRLKHTQKRYSLACTASRLQQR